MDRPNILYLHSHDTGRYVQPYGHAVETPNIQRLAEKGTLFRRAFCANPTCSPSRASLLTGQYAHTSGMMGLAHRGFALKNPEQHLVHTLRKAGYESALAGLQHVAKDPYELGYDHALSPDEKDAPSAAQRAAEFLSRRHERPFFLDVGFFDTHRRFPPAEKREDPRWSLPPAPLPDTPETRADMAAYKASVRRLDESVGLVLDALDDSRLAENTLLVCTTDHGIAFPQMKCNLTDHGIGVMLIVRGPGGFEGGRVVDAMVSQIDLFPTICELAGIAPPEWLQGRSILPLIRNETEVIREEVFAEVNYHAAYEPQRCVRTDRWKYIVRYEPRESPVFPNCDESPSKTYLLENGWRDQPPEPEALYDLIFDPNETRNLIGVPQARVVLQEMRSRLDRWMQDTDDPILRGPIPLPCGAIATAPDAMRP